MRSCFGIEWDRSFRALAAALGASALIMGGFAMLVAAAEIAGAATLTESRGVAAAEAQAEVQIRVGRSGSALPLI